MIVEAVSEFGLAIVRFIGYCMTEVVVEILCRGAGYRICRLFSSNVNRESFRVFIVGLIFWGVIFTLVTMFFNSSSQALEIDKCLDRGGSFNYQTNTCRYE